MKKQIKLGDKVRDRVTGYTGIAVSRTEFINGCIQYGVARRLKLTEDMKLDDPGIDEMVLKVVKERVIDSKEYQREDDDDDDDKESSDGGPTRIVKRMRGH